jgi:hypothetical protein
MYELMLYINPDELARYTRLQSRLERGEFTKYKMCGGKLIDALAWSRPNVDMAPTCGRHVLCDELHQEGCAWYKSDSRYWYCPVCSREF